MSIRTPRFLSWSFQVLFGPSRYWIEFSICDNLKHQKGALKYFFFLRVCGGDHQPLLGLLISFVSGDTLIWYASVMLLFWCYLLCRECASIVTLWKAVVAKEMWYYYCNYQLYCLFHVNGSSAYFDLILIFNKRYQGILVLLLYTITEANIVVLWIYFCKEGVALGVSNYYILESEN